MKSSNGGKTSHLGRLSGRNVGYHSGAERSEFNAELRLNYDAVTSRIVGSKADHRQSQMSLLVNARQDGARHPSGFSSSPPSGGSPESLQRLRKVLGSKSDALAAAFRLCLWRSSVLRR